MRQQLEHRTIPESGLENINICVGVIKARKNLEASTERWKGMEEECHWEEAVHCFSPWASQPPQYPGSSH